jgi:hypothetical protein
MLALLSCWSIAASKKATAVAESCLPGHEWSHSLPGDPGGAERDVHIHYHAQHLQQMMAGHSLRVVSEKGQFRTLPAGETKPAPRGDVPCAIAAHATKSDGSAGRAGEVAVVIHQVALGMRFSSDLKLGDLVPLEPGVPGTTYSFEVQPGFLNAVLAKMPLRADEQDELYEQLKKPRDEELYEQVKNVKDEV